MPTLTQLKDQATLLGISIPSRSNKTTIATLIEGHNAGQSKLALEELTKAKEKAKKLGIFFAPGSTLEHVNKLITDHDKGMAIHRLPSMATQARLEKPIHDGSEIQKNVTAQKKRDQAIADRKLKEEITAVEESRTIPIVKPKITKNRLESMDLGLFLSDVPDLRIRKDQNVPKPTFRKITLVKRFVAIDVITGSALCCVFIDKLGYRFYLDDGTKIRYARKDKKIMIDRLSKVYNCEVYLKEDNLTRLRFSAYSIDRVSYTSVDRPYNGDPTVFSHFMVIKNENKIVGSYETLELAKMACLHG